MWRILRSAAADFTKLYPRCEAEVVAPEAPSPHHQQLLLDGLLKEDCDAICVVPIDPDAIRSVINRLVIGGRPVVTIGRDVPSSNRVVFCGPAESDIGRAAAAACGPALFGRMRTIMLLHGGRENEVHRGRYYAFKNDLPMHGDLQVLDEVDCRGGAIDATRLVRSKSRLYPRVGGWVFLEDWPLRTLRPDERLLPLGCVAILCDCSPRYFDRVRTGEIHALITFDFSVAVEDALRAAYRLGAGTTAEQMSIIVTPTEIITAKKLDWYERRWESWQQEESKPDGSSP